MSDLPQITGATGTSGDLGRTASTANLKKAGDRFEAMFTQLMLKSMRQAKLAEPLFDSKAIDTFTEMSDAKVAASMAEHQPLGIGKALTAFLAKGRKGAGSPARDAAVPGGGDKADLNHGPATPSA